ncbi:hypothetical protein JHW43_004396 [Diplocarpon mali]|nr:hypothetical protein JHW43_004396 [Diplocarpon mali]
MAMKLDDLIEDLECDTHAVGRRPSAPTSSPRCGLVATTAVEATSVLTLVLLLVLLAAPAMARGCGRRGVAVPSRIGHRATASLPITPAAPLTLPLILVPSVLRCALYTGTSGHRVSIRWLLAPNPEASFHLSLAHRRGKVNKTAAAIAPPTLTGTSVPKVQVAGQDHDDEIMSANSMQARREAKSEAQSLGINLGCVARPRESGSPYGVFMRPRKAEV